MKRMVACCLLVGLTLGIGFLGVSEQKEIVLWSLYSETRETLLNELAQEFEAETGVKVKVEFFANDPYKISLAAAFAAGEPPDIFFNWGGGLLRNYVEAGAVAAITEALRSEQWRGPGDIPWIEAFKPAGLTLSTYDGKNYGIPWQLAGVGIFYNKAIFADVGIDLPETIWDLFEAVPVLKSAGYIPFTLGNKDRWPGAFYLIYLVDRLGGKEIFNRATAGDPDVGFDHPVFVLASTLIAELVKAGAFNEGFNDIGYSDSRASFNAGISAMQLMGGWVVRYLNEEAPELVPDVGFVPFPAVGLGNPTGLVGGTNPTYSISSKAVERGVFDEAVELLRLLSSEKWANRWLNEAKELVAIKGVDPDPQTDTLLYDVSITFGKASHLQNYYDQFLPPPLAQSHLDTCQAVFGLILTPEEAMAQWEAARREYFNLPAK